MYMQQYVKKKSHKKTRINKQVNRNKLNKLIIIKLNFYTLKNLSIKSSKQY